MRMPVITIVKHGSDRLGNQPYSCVETHYSDRCVQIKMVAGWLWNPLFKAEKRYGRFYIIPSSIEPFFGGKPSFIPPSKQRATWKSIFREQRRTLRNYDRRRKRGKHVGGN